MKAYPKADYDTAKVNASKLLTSANICRRISDYLDLAGFNDANVDKQLYLLLMQNVDLPTKARAIAEYNKLKQRITEKVVSETKITLSDKDREVLSKVLPNYPNNAT